MNFLEVTTNVGCPVRCCYCPQQEFLRAYGDSKKKLDIKDFSKCLDKLPKGAEVGFSGFSEPWNNKDCTTMVMLCKGRFPITVYTTLVGMSIENVETMRDLKFENFSIHLPGSEGYENIPITDEYLKVLAACKERFNVTYASFGTLPQKVAEIVGEVPKTTPDLMVSRAGLLSCYGRNITIVGPVRCHNQWKNEMLDHNVLLPDGRVVVCCMDFGMKFVLGNLFEQSYESLFSGAAADNIRQGLRGRTQILCHKCEYGVQYG
jgi:hypothetical protein